MDPIVAAAIVTAIGGLGTALIARRLHAQAEEAKAEAVQTTNELQGMSIQLEGWPKLYQAAVADIDRLKADVAEERAIAEAFDTKARRLEAELAEEREKSAEWRRIVARLREEQDDDGTDG